MSSQTVGVFGLPSKSVIPKYARDYKREYQFIKGINNVLGHLLKNGYFNNETYVSKKAERVKDSIKKYFIGREKGKLGNISSVLDLKGEDLGNILIFFRELIEYSLCYNIYSKEYGDDGKPYPGIRDFFKVFCKFINEINNETSDSDSDSDNEIKIILDSDSDSDYEIKLILDSESDSD